MQVEQRMKLQARSQVDCSLGSQLRSKMMLEEYRQQAGTWAQLQWERHMDSAARGVIHIQLLSRLEARTEPVEHSTMHIRAWLRLADDYYLRLKVHFDLP